MAFSLIVSVLSAFMVVARLTSAETVLSCCSPLGAIALSVYELDATTNTTTIVSPAAHINFNAVYHSRHGYTYVSDRDGAFAIHTTKTKLRIGQGASLNDFPRWTQDGGRIAFTSTREANPNLGASWSAVFTSDWDGTTLSPPVRWTPVGEADFSPAWSPSGELIAAATGSGHVGGADIVVMSLRDRRRRVVALNGGYPAWQDEHTLLFHRAQDVANNWAAHDIIALDLDTMTERVLVPNAMTPFVHNGTLLYTYDPSLRPTDRRQIYSYTFATKARHQVTASMSNHYYPTLTDRGTILFSTCRGGVMPNVWRRTSGDDSLDYACTNGDFPYMSPDGSQIVVTDPHFVGMALFQADGSRRQVLRNTSSWYTSWSPQGEIAFTDGKAFQPSTDNTVQVATFQKDDGWKVKLLTSGHAAGDNQGAPSFSPDGEFIVYRKRAGTLPAVSPAGFPGTYRLEVMRKNGTQSRPLTVPPKSGPYGIGDVHPLWGPNGTIAFASDRGHKPVEMGIWTVNADGTNLREVFWVPRTLSVHPTFTSDGKKIIFTSTVAGFSMEEIAFPGTFNPNSELFSINVDGTDLRRITHDGNQNANAFSGSKPLPKSLSIEGVVTACDYFDVMDVVPQNGREKGGATPKKGGCPFFHPTAQP